MMWRALGIALTLLVAACAAYLATWPTPVDPVAWQAPASAGYSGAFAVNARLATLNHIGLDGDEGPEHIAERSEDGIAWVYMALASGKIVRTSPDGARRELVVQTGGRPLGFDFEPDGALIVADPMFGAHGALLRVRGRAADARIEVLADAIDDPVPGDALRYIDAVVVARDGRMYFTDASRRFGPKDFGGTFNASVLDSIEHRATGRVLQFDPQSGRVRVLMKDLCFANGIALATDERSVFVNETCAYRIWRLDVQAEGLSATAAAQAGAQVLLDNLPGFPDNLMRGRDGRIWAGLVKPRSAVIDVLAQWPGVRKATMRLPQRFWPVPPSYGHVFAFDESGKVVANLQDATGAYPATTAITETEDRLYVQSLHAKSLGWLPAAALRQ